MWWSGGAQGVWAQSKYIVRVFSRVSFYFLRGATGSFEITVSHHVSTALDSHTPEPAFPGNMRGGPPVGGPGVGWATGLDL